MSQFVILYWFDEKGAQKMRKKHGPSKRDWTQKQIYSTAYDKREATQQLWHVAQTYPGCMSEVKKAA